MQDAKFQQTLLDYRTAVLTANQEAEDGLVTFLKAHEQAKTAARASSPPTRPYEIVVAQYRVGTVDFTTVSTIEQNLVLQQDLHAQARARSPRA